MIRKIRNTARNSNNSKGSDENKNLKISGDSTERSFKTDSVVTVGSTFTKAAHLPPNWLPPPSPQAVGAMSRLTAQRYNWVNRRQSSGLTPR